MTPESGSDQPGDQGQTDRWASRSLRLALAAAALAVVLSGCACPRANLDLASLRPFNFQNDTFAFANELTWVYEYNSQGKWTTHTRYPKPSYSQHCFVVARSARQFFLNARFAPGLPAADDATYRRLIDKVVATNPRHPLPENKKIAIPGYRDLRDFSAAHAGLLKRECGAAWHSYVQRGHWRIVFPFSRAHEQTVAMDLLAHARAGDAVVVHLVRFPQLTINHAVMVFAATEEPDKIIFDIYDPNLPSHPRTITYDRSRRTFYFPQNDYFPGGKLNVYEVYNKWDY